MILQSKVSNTKDKRIQSNYQTRLYLLWIKDEGTMKKGRLTMGRKDSFTIFWVDYKQYFDYSMVGALEIFLIAQCSYQVAYNILFGIIFCRKVLKLDKLGDNLDVTIPKTTWVKFGFIIAIMFLMIAHIIAAYSDPLYWENDYANFSLVNILFLVNYTMQLLIIVREVRKCKQRHLASLFYWGITAISFLVEIIVVENLSVKLSTSLILNVVIGLLNIGLVLITVIFQRSKYPNNQVMLHIITTPSMYPSDGFKITGESRRKQLYIQFNKQFQVIQKQEETVCVFNIAVYFEDAVKIITKSQIDFQHLAFQLNRLFPNSPQVSLPKFNHHYQNMMRYGEEKQKFFEPYLAQLIKTDQFYCPPLLQFLELPNTVRLGLSHTQRFQFSKKQSLYSQEEDRLKIPFFKVSNHKDKIFISNPDILQLMINKSRQEIIEFHDKLINEKRLTMELIPQNPTEDDFLHFFQIVVNRKALWRCFAVWFGLGGQLQEKIYNYFDVWNIGFKNVEMKVIGNQKNFDKEGKIHTLYLLSIQRKHHHGSEQNENDVVILKKRYSDFLNLNKEVLRFIHKNKLRGERLPQMPPKLSPFGSQTSPNSRVARFDYYIKQLIRIEGMSQCIKLLEFLEIDGQSSPIDLYESAQIASDLFEHSERSYFGDLSDRILF